MSLSERFFALACCALSLFTAGAAGAAAQPAVDTLLTWQSYSHARSAHVRVFPSSDEDRPRVVVLDERAESRGGPLTDEAQYVAETVGRTLGFDPVAATFVFRFTGAGFVPEADRSGKMLLLRATFRRGASGALNAPSWRVITRDGLADLTDRALY